MDANTNDIHRNSGFAQASTARGPPQGKRCHNCIRDNQS